MPYDAIIIGGGPAGLSAGCYLAEHKWRTLVLDAAWNENQLSGKNILPDIKFMEILKQKFEKAGGIFDNNQVEKINITPKSRQVLTTRGDSFFTEAVVVATGTSAHGSHFDGEKEFLGRGVSYDLQSSVLSGKNKAVVIGKSLPAINSAIRLSDILSMVTFVIPANRIDVADEKWQEMKRRKAKLNMLFSASLKEVKGVEKVESATIFSGGKEETIEADIVLFYAHEFKPRVEFLPDSVQKAECGEIMVDENLCTSQAGIFAAGEVICKNPQIPLISSAQGIIAGQSVEKFLLEE